NYGSKHQASNFEPQGICKLESPSSRERPTHRLQTRNGVLWYLVLGASMKFGALGLKFLSSVSIRVHLWLKSLLLCNRSVYHLQQVSGLQTMQILPHLRAEFRCGNPVAVSQVGYDL